MGLLYHFVIAMEPMAEEAISAGYDFQIASLRSQ
jgi:hypothetical protein